MYTSSFFLPPERSDHYPELGGNQTREVTLTITNKLYTSLSISYFLAHTTDTSTTTKPDT